MVGRLSRKSGSSRRPSRKSRTGRETLSEVQNWSRDAPGGLELVGRPSQKSESGWETLLEVLNWSEALTEVRNWSGDAPRGPELIGIPSRSPEVVVGPLGGPELVGRPTWRSLTGRGPSRRSRSGRETLQEIWKWSRDTPGGPEEVGRPSRRFGSRWNTLPGGPELVGRPSPEVRTWLRDPPRSL